MKYIVIDSTLYLFSCNSTLFGYVVEIIWLDPLLEMQEGEWYEKLKKK